MLWYILALASALFATLSALAEKKSLKNIESLEFSSAVSILNLLFSFAFLTRADFSIPPKLIALMYLISILGAAAFLLITKSLRHMDISLVSPLLNLNPAILALLAYLILGERLGTIRLIGLILITAGAYALEIQPKTKSRAHLLSPLNSLVTNRYLRYAIYSATLYALSSIGDKFVLGYTDQYTYLIVMHFFIAFNFIILMRIKKGTLSGMAHAYKSSGRLIFAVALFTVLYRFFQLWAVSLTLVSLVVPIKRLSTLFSTLLGGSMFHEEGITQRAIACIIMLIGAWLLVAA